MNQRELETLEEELKAADIGLSTRRRILRGLGAEIPDMREYAVVVSGAINLDEVARIYHKEELLEPSGLIVAALQDSGYFKYNMFTFSVRDLP